MTNREWRIAASCEIAAVEVRVCVCVSFIESLIRVYWWVKNWNMHLHWNNLYNHVVSYIIHCTKNLFSSSTDKLFFLCCCIQKYSFFFKYFIQRFDSPSLHFCYMVASVSLASEELIWPSSRSPCTRSSRVQQESELGNNPTAELDDPQLLPDWAAGSLRSWM